MPPSSIAAQASEPSTRVWYEVSWNPLPSLWNLEGVSPKLILARTWRAFFADNLPGRAAQLGYFFLFSLFPALFCASAMLGLAARSAASIYVKLLESLADFMPPAAFGIVIQTFHQTTSASTAGKVTFGLVAALWSASVGTSAIQDTLNHVYKVKESRPYWKRQLNAIAMTIVLSLLVTLSLAALFGSGALAAWLRLRIPHGDLIAMPAHVLGIMVAIGLFTLVFALIYYWAPDVKTRRWRWLTPGAAVGLAGWLLATLGLRLYLHFFNTFSVTYGSLGAVIILLLWFYITGLMLLLGAEINSEIEVCVAERHLAAAAEDSSLPQANRDAASANASPEGFAQAARFKAQS